MIIYCKKCKSEIVIPMLTEGQKLEIWGLNDQSMIAIAKIAEYGKLNLTEAKKIHDHVNKEYGNCIRCNNTDLKGENVTCPKCNAFNINWEINLSFNERFCLHLEYLLVEKFKELNTEETKGFWCDGISWNPKDKQQLSKKNVNDKKRIETIAWLGKSGQEQYFLTIELGKDSLKRYSKGSCLIDCIPDTNPKHWMEINTESKKMKIKMN